MNGVVPAAGKGTRLRPQTEDTPKGLIDINGKPLLSHVFETLINAGITELYVVVGYKADQIIRAFGDAYEGVPITYVHQREQKGLGHAILQTEQHLRAQDEPFIVLNGDNIVAGTITEPLTVGQTEGVDGVVVIEDANAETARTTGVVVTDEKNNVRDIIEKPDKPKTTTITTGLYVLPPEIFPALKLVQPSDRGEIELADALGLLIKARMNVRAVPLDRKRVNVNTPADVARAREILQR